MTTAGARAAPAVLAVLLTPALLAPPATAATFTTFQARSEGCSGGGDVCGTFPLIPAGDATYGHAAGTDGGLDVSAAAEGGIPSCLGDACVPALSRYHAEADALVWVDADIPAGAHAVTMRADYRLLELIATADAVLGRAASSLVGAVTAAEAPDTPAATCSDGSAVVGRASAAITAATTPGDHALTTTVTCAGPDGLLSAARWRIALSVKVGATTDGGSAEARARAALIGVIVDVHL